MDVQRDGYVAIKTVFDRSILNEVAIHRELNHPNIIRLLDHQTEAAKRKTSLVMEYADDGSLQEKINEKKLDKEDIKKVFREVCQAIRYLHESKIVHGDIKPENVVMTKRGEAKLCDFGSASRFGQQRSNSGTLEYLAPESVLSYPQNHKVDVWALGILLFEMITGAAPFKGKTKDEIIKDMKRTLFFSDVFDETEIELVKRILRVNPENRPEVSEILNHRYFKDNYEKCSSGVSTEGCIESEDFGGMKFVSEPYRRREEGDLPALLHQKEQKLNRIRRQYRLQSHELSEISKLL